MISNMIKEALEALKNGEIVLVFDSDNRERETDRRTFLYTTFI